MGTKPGSLRAQMCDLYPPWVGARALLLHGQNPYGPEVSHEIQMGFYGHIVSQDYSSGQKIVDEQRFAYPVYVVFLLAPVVFAPFPMVATWAAGILFCMIVVSVIVSVDALNWRPSKTSLAAIIIFVLCTPQVMQGLRLLQLGIVVGSFLSAALWCIHRKHLALAGVFLSLATIKPQMSVLPLIWCVLWALSEIDKRWRLIAGLAVALIALVGLGEAVLPPWPLFFIRGLNAYRKYNGMPSVLSLFFSDLGGLLIAVALATALVALMWRFRGYAEDSREFAQIFSLTLLAATIALPLLPPFNQILLLLPAMMVLRDYEGLPSGGRWFFAAFVACPWLVRLILLILRVRTDSPSGLPLLPSALAVCWPGVLSVLFALGQIRREQQIQNRQAHS
jgi:hypothetical protein